MDWFRIRHTLAMCTILTGKKRAEYLRKKKVLYHVGNNCMVMFRKIPLYPRLISLGNNVWIASQVSFVTHDVIHNVLNNKLGEKRFTENIGCIQVQDNVFIGSNSTILSDVSIGPDTIVAAGSLVNKSIGGGVYGGVPVRYICSMEEFMNKRMEKQNAENIQNRTGEMTESIIEQYWDVFRKKSNGIGL